MKKSSSLFYSIGFILNVLGIILTGLFLATFAFGLSDSELVIKFSDDTGSTIDFTTEIFTIIIVILSITLFIEIAVLVAVIFAKKDIKKETGRVALHVVLLILGLLSFNLLYLLGGIFGVVAANSALQEDDD